MPDKAINSRKASGNPFTPEFGREPVYFAGRESILDEITLDLEEESNICALLVGPRGTGKTATLTYLSGEAERFGVVAVNVTSVLGMLDDIYQRTLESAQHLIGENDSKKVKGVKIAGLGGIEWENSQQDAGNWRTKMNRVLDALEEKDTGLLITVDEVDVSLDEMSQLVANYQHFVREKRRVSLIMAGLPYNVSLLLNGSSTSFLRRAQRFELGSLRDQEVEEAFRLTVEDGGKNIDREALQAAVESIGGFPFMMQLLGHRAWRASEDSPYVSMENIEKGSRLAKAELEHRIYEPTYRDLSKADREFLKAMLPDAKSTSRQNLMERLKKPSGHISTYRKRLMEAGLIHEDIEGELRFSLPGFREYLEALVRESR